MSRPSKFINIGGVTYSRTAMYGCMQIQIVAYDINTERHILIENSDRFGKPIRVELDNDKLKLREKYQRLYK